MPPIVAPTIVRIATHFGMNNTQVAFNIWDIGFDPGTLAERDSTIPAMVNSFQNIFQDKLCPLVQKPVEYTGCEYHDLDSLDSFQGSLPPNGSKPVNNGTTTMPPAPPQVAILVTKICSHTRRQRPGRTYFPGIGSGNVLAGGLIASSAKAVIQTAFGDFLTAVNGITPPAIDGSVALRVVHKNGPTSWSSSDVTALVVNDYVATQRGRSFYDA